MVGKAQDSASEVRQAAARALAELDDPRAVQALILLLRDPVLEVRLDAIFALIDELNAVDTRGVVPMAHAQDLSLPLRDDVVTEADRHGLFQRTAPAVEDGLYLVPKVIE